MWWDQLSLLKNLYIFNWISNFKISSSGTGKQNTFHLCCTMGHRWNIKREYCTCVFIQTRHMRILSTSDPGGILNMHMSSLIVRALKFSALYKNSMFRCMDDIFCGVPIVPSFCSIQTLVVNPLRAKFFRGNINIYLHLMSLLHIEMTHVLKILPQVRAGPTYSTWSISWLLMSWWHKEPGHQQSWYWPS